MPDANGTDKGQAAPPAAPKDDKVKLPPTPEERHKARLEKAAKESDDERSERRAKELGVHIAAHTQYVAEAHEKFPAPLHNRWDDYTDEEKKNWNLRGQEIASANRAFHLAVRQTFAEHQAEDRHVSKLHADAAKKAQENV